ncbi:MAG: hypothetical protein V9F01_00360 [Chitinophagaceae bacterium]
MRYLFIIILAFGFLPGKAQQNEVFIASSGSGFGEIKLGMSEEQVRKILPGKFNEANFTQKMQEFKDFNSDIRIDSLVQFVLGFDKILTATDEMLITNPVYNLGFKENKLNYIGIISYPPADVVAKDVLLDEKITIFMQQEECIQILGEDYIPIRFMDYADHIYYNKGVETIYDEGMLRCIIIFEPTPDFLKLIDAKKDKLMEQFKTIEKK